MFRYDPNNPTYTIDIPCEVVELCEFDNELVDEELLTNGYWHPVLDRYQRVNKSKLNEYKEFLKQFPI